MKNIDFYQYFHNESTYEKNQLNKPIKILIRK